MTCSQCGFYSAPGFSVRFWNRSRATFGRTPMTPPITQDFALHASQTIVAILVAIGESFVVNAETFEHHRLQVINASGLLGDIVATIVGGALGHIARDQLLHLASSTVGFTEAVWWCSRNASACRTDVSNR